MKTNKIIIVLLIAAAVVLGTVFLSMRGREIQGPYLTITETETTDEEADEMISNCYTYEIGKERLKKQGEVSNTAGYPLTLYSTKKGKVLYIAYSGNGDQLYQSAKRKAEQMTDQFCGFNHMFQCQDQLFMAAKYLEHYCIEPVMLDLTSNEITQLLIDKSDDTFTWSTSCDPKNNRIVFSCYSDSEMRAKLDFFDGDPERKEYPGNPKSKIYLYYIEKGELKQVFDTSEYLYGIAVDDKNIYYSAGKSSLSPKGENQLMRVSIKTGEEELVPCPISITGDMAVWNNELYCVGWMGDQRGCYRFHLKTGAIKEIYSAPENGFLNGMSMSY